tara:strand:+ start:15552 stop:17165 length:1614 start_codon:yes stop_codon:yes gene_type:complete
LATSDIASVLQHSSDLTLLFLTLADQNFSTVVAQLNLTPRQLSLQHARVIKMMALGLILSRGFGWQPQRSQHFLQAICLHAAATPDTNAIPLQTTLTMAKALQHYNKQHPLLSLLIAYCNAKRQLAWQCHPDGPLMAMLNQLVVQMLPKPGSQAGLEQLLLQYRSGQTGIAAAKWFGILQQLVAYHALPGRFGKDIQTTGNHQQYWLICGRVAAQHPPTVVYVRKFDPSTKALDNTLSELPLAQLTLLSPQYFRDPSWLATLEQDDMQLPAPPVVTLKRCLEQSIFNQLHPLSISRQVQLLKAQPLVSRFLEQAAGNISRQQLPVTQLRHAITMLGQDALSDWVGQAELYQYCQQQAHPHHDWLEQLRHCLNKALLLLSDAAKVPLAACTAGLVSHCATLSLWQHAALPQLALAKQLQQKLVLGLHIQQQIWQNKHYPAQLKLLLQHYQHPDWATAMDDWQSKQPPLLTLLLTMSWQLTLAVFCPTDANTQRLTTLLPAASARLHLPSHPAEYWQQLLVAASHCYYPLPESSPVSEI